MLCQIADLFVEVPEAGGMSPRCREYICEETFSADIIIRTERYCLEKYTPDVDWDLIAYMESGRQFASRLPFFGGFYLHSSAIELDGHAYLFSGTSGVGKSTHTRLWQEEFGPKASVFNDDKPALRYMDGKWYAYGTPWCGKDGINKNVKVPLAGICFLKQGPENRIRNLSAKESIPRLLSQTIHGFSKKQSLILLLDLLEKLVNTVPIFELENRPDEEAVRLSYTTMSCAAKEKQL